MEIDFFNSGKSRTGASRKAIMKSIDDVDNRPSSDYMDFGYDYFDNAEMGIGYGGYRYDGRYADPVKRICDHYGLKAGDKVLEIGCAKGYVLIEFQKLGMEVQGADLSKYAVEHCHEDLRGKIRFGEVTEMNFTDNEFALVFGKEVLPHVPEQKIDQTLLECMRVSKGALFFEIQTGTSKEALDEIYKWDQTHQILKDPSWWLSKFEEIGYPGDVNFKFLF